MSERKAKRRVRKARPRLAQPTRAPWEPPALRPVGAIADLVQQTKVSGNTDGGGTKRHS